MRSIRAALRAIQLLIWFFAAGVHYIFTVWLVGKHSSIPARAAWLQVWAHNYFKLLNGRLTWDGIPPKNGVLVSNHLSYVDILTYGSIMPMVFLSKSEVRSWPVIGWLTRCAGTLYIRRQTKSDVVPLATEMDNVVKTGTVITLFLEGTSTGGDVVLPFRSSLLSTTEDHGWPVTPAWVHYSMTTGSVSDEVCYWRDMTLFPHLLNLLLKKEGFSAHVCFGETITEKMDRKTLAKELHARVCQMREKHLAAK